MADENSYTEGRLATDVAPPARARDDGGRFAAETQVTDRMFAPRAVEGDPETGDTSDGGDDPALVAREREVRARSDVQRRQVAEEPDDEEQGIAETDDESAVESDDDGAEEDEGEKYPVVVDGEEREVSLKEALAGYVRTSTFHKRMSDLNTIQGNMELKAHQLTEGWAAWHKAVKAYEQDVFALIPQEPDWDVEFRRDPVAAHANQKIYQSLYQQLADSRAKRLEREAKDDEEAQAKLKQYAEWGYARFVQMNSKTLRNQRDIDNNLKSMRRTAVAVGFSEPEVTTVFDPRMLTILLKASKYDRMQAAQVRAEDPGRGRTLTPGAATPRLGNAPRKGLDEAQKRLQNSGRLDDAAVVMSHFLRG